MNKKEKYIIAALGSTLVIIAFTMIFFILSGSSSQEQSLNPTPAQTQTQKTITPRPFYNQKAQARLLEKLNNRRTLSQQDTTAKEKMVSVFPSGKPSGILYSSNNIRIEYVSAADQVQVEIVTTDVFQAKKDAVVWLKLQGISQQAICDLPVMFYLNYSVANQLRNQNIIFNPLAEGC